MGSCVSFLEVRYVETRCNLCVSPSDGTREIGVVWCSPFICLVGWSKAWTLDEMRDELIARRREEIRTEGKKELFYAVACMDMK